MSKKSVPAKKPVPAIRAKPGEYFLAAEHVAVGMRFQVFDAVYEIVGEPKKWGVGWLAKVRVIEGFRVGAEFPAMLWTGRQV